MQRAAALGGVRHDRSGYSYGGCLHVTTAACRATTARSTGRRCAATVSGQGTASQKHNASFWLGWAAGWRLPAPNTHPPMFGPMFGWLQLRLSSTCCSRARTGTCATSRTRWASLGCSIYVHMCTGTGQHIGQGVRAAFQGFSLGSMPSMLADRPAAGHARSRSSWLTATC